MEATKTVAIIGAGLSGLALALSLHRQGVDCVIYEARPEPLDIGGAIMVSPNAIKIFDELGLEEKINSYAYRFQTLHFYKEDGNKLDEFDFGTRQKHGHDGMRIYRFELIRVFLEALKEAGINPVFGKKFTKVTEENENGVSWEFEDGTTGTASLLIGADGIHSRVRRHISPDSIPKFTHMIGVTAAVPTAQVNITEEDGVVLPLTIMNKKHGAFVAAPQRHNGTEILIGKQARVTEEPDRAGWDRITQDKQWSIDFLRQGAEDYPPFVTRAVSNISPHGVNLWPFYLIPKLDSWISDSGRVVILGDAAHAIPPTAGQGVNQAFEDVFVFASMMGRLNDKALPNMKPLVRAWQQERQDRVDKVLELNDKLNQRRLPSSEGEDPLAGGSFEMEWLYNVDYKATVDRIMAHGD